MTAESGIDSLSSERSLPASISIVIPCHNEEEVLGKLWGRISILLDQLSFPAEVILIDDGSTDSTWRQLIQLQRADARVKAIKLSRNFGHQIALTAGLDQANGEVIVIMDADLQDPPELVPEMVALWRRGYDVVYGQRRSREGESPLKRFFAFSFYRVLERIGGISIPRDTGDFRLIGRPALNALLKLREKHRFIRGMVSWIGFKQTPFLYDRPERAAGTTKYPFRRSLLLAMEAITSFSYAPLRIASYLGVAISGFAFVYIFVVIALKILGINFPGYTSLMASILLLGGVQLIVLGIIGEYIGRIFEQGQNRPLYIIEDLRGEPLGHSAGDKRACKDGV